MEAKVKLVASRRRRRHKLLLLGFAAAVLVGAAFPAARVVAATPAWTILPSPNSSTSQSNALDGTSCVKGKTNFCMVVGGYYTGTSPVIKHTEIQRWNGTSLSIVSSPDATGSSVGSSFLDGVSCPTTAFCMTAGFYTQNGGLPDQTLIERWSGTAWTIVSSPNVSGVSNHLNSVSCPTATYCIAVGETVTSGFLEQTLIEQWNGTAWSIVTSPDTSPSQDDFLWGVSCPQATFCMADGYYDDSSGNQLPLILRWKTGVWKLSNPVAPSPTASPATDSLWSVSCVSSSFCIATGDYYSASSVAQNLVEAWNGTAWSIATSPNTASTQENGVYAGVSCATTAFCMDATFCCDNVAFDQTLTLRWTTAWAIVASPDTSTTQNDRLQSASCPTATFCLAAGQYTNGTTKQNLVERWH